MKEMGLQKMVTISFDQRSEGSSKIRKHCNALKDTIWVFSGSLDPVFEDKQFDVCLRFQERGANIWLKILPEAALPSTQTQGIAVAPFVQVLRRSYYSHWKQWHVSCSTCIRIQLPIPSVLSPYLHELCVNDDWVNKMKKRASFKNTQWNDRKHYIRNWIKWDSILITDIQSLLWEDVFTMEW